MPLPGAGTSLGFSAGFLPSPFKTNRTLPQHFCQGCKFYQRQFWHFEKSQDFCLAFLQDFLENFSQSFLEKYQIFLGNFVHGFSANDYCSNNFWLNRNVFCQASAYRHKVLKNNAVLFGILLKPQYC